MWLVRTSMASWASGRMSASDPCLIGHAVAAAADLRTAWRSRATGRSGRGGTTTTASWATGRRRTITPVQVLGPDGRGGGGRGQIVTAWRSRTTGRSGRGGTTTDGQLGDGTTTQPLHAGASAGPYRRGGHRGRRVPQPGAQERRHGLGVGVQRLRPVGRRDDDAAASAPVQVPGLTGVVAVAAGY